MDKRAQKLRNFYREYGCSVRHFIGVFTDVSTTMSVCSVARKIRRLNGLRERLPCRRAGPPAIAFGDWSNRKTRLSVDESRQMSQIVSILRPRQLRPSRTVLGGALASVSRRPGAGLLSTTHPQCALSIEHITCGAMTV